ncbi:rod-binding protein [Sphingosinicella sp.]|uniref:rod-binding protein n=1 Tax=Sphingosinicella sp. TaxID=1917971 RepID=UPI0040379F28
MTGPVANPATPTALGASGTPSTEAQREQLRQAAQAFEAIFLRQMIGSMRNARLAEDVFGSASSEQFRDMGDAQLADSMSRQGSFGIAELLLAQFNRAIPAAPAAATGEANSSTPNGSAS